MDETILCQSEDGIATVTINRPEKRNAINRVTWTALAETMDALSADESLRCVIIRGAGTAAFSAGADISGFETERSNSSQVKEYDGEIHRAVMAVTEGRHPVVAMIHGYCIGGGFELATTCDIRICGESSRLGVPVKTRGLYLGYDLLEALIHTVGRPTALEITLEGRVYSAEEALAKNMVHRVVADDALEAEAMATARRIADGAPLSARYHRQAIRRLAHPVPITDEEIEQSYSYADTEDYQASYRAFLAKEKPRFEGR